MMHTETLARPGCQFASDNAAGICPEAWQSLAEANLGYAKAYGEDRWTARASDLLREVFETDAQVFFTFGGTAANSLALSAMCQSYNSVICSDVSHVETDECGGPEFFSNGIKLLLAPSTEGKLHPDAVEEIVRRRTDVHYPKPRVLSITQPTELGTLYSIEELHALDETSRRLGSQHQMRLRIHMDGARLANAVAAMNVAPKEITWQAGVDVLCLGGTKNGLPVGDVVMFFNRELGVEFDYRCKQAGQLASKMRYLSAPWVGILQSGAWLEHARHANQCAAALEQQLAAIAGVEILCPRQANAVFAKLPPPWIAELRRRGWEFYTFIGKGGMRLMCSWATTTSDVAAFVADVQSLKE